MLHFVVIIVFLAMVKETIHKYLDYRLRMADRQLGTGDRNLLRAMEELRAEIAALKRHETDAILSFDSTLQTLDARVKHLERRALGDVAADRASLGAGEPRRSEVAHAEVSGAVPVATSQPSRSQ